MVHDEAPFQALSAPAFRARGLATGLRRVDRYKQTPDENQYHVARFAVLLLGLLCGSTMGRFLVEFWSPSHDSPAGTRTEWNLSDADALHAVRDTAFPQI